MLIIFYYSNNFIYLTLVPRDIQNSMENEVLVSEKSLKERWTKM